MLLKLMMIISIIMALTGFKEGYEHYGLLEGLLLSSMGFGLCAGILLKKHSGK